MSFGATSVAWHHSKATGNDLLVLMAIANYISDEGAWPRIQTIAKDARVSERSVYRHLDNLKALGEIDWETKGGSGKGIYKSNRYWLRLTCPSTCRGDWNHTIDETKIDNLTGLNMPKVTGLDMTEMADKQVIEPNKEIVIKSNKQKFSEDWQPGEKLVAEMLEKYPKANLAQYVAEMKDWYLLKGKESTIKDMNAAFRSWMRQADRFANGALSKKDERNWWN